VSDELTKYLLSGEPLASDAQQFLSELDGGLRLSRSEFWVSEDPLNVDPPRFTFHADNGRVWDLKWSDRLSDELWRRHIKMSQKDHEAARCGMHLSSNMRYSDIRFGSDYSNSVLVEVVRERFGHIPVIAESLDLAPTYPPNKEGSFLECFSYLKHAIDGLGNSLVLQFEYDNKEAFPILAAAVWFLIERRFSLPFLRAAKGM
jgi:hypothetical protein